MRDRDGWRALGYESWEEFGAKEFDYSVQYLNRITTAAVIQKSLETIVSEGEIKETHLRPLTSIPENERAAIWEEANRKAEEAGKERTAKMVQDVVNEWKAKHEAQQQRLDFLELNHKGIKEQNDELRNELTLKVESKVEERLAGEKARLILENSSAMQGKQKEFDDAQDALMALKEQMLQLKKEQEKAITEGINIEKNKIQTDLNQVLYQIEVNKRDLEDLKKVRRELDAEVGAIAVHKTAIKEIKNNLSFLTTSFADAFDTSVIPTEVYSDWQQIRTNFKKLDAQMDSFFDDHAPIDGAVLVGEVVN